MNERCPSREELVERLVKLFAPDDELQRRRNLKGCEANIKICEAAAPDLENQEELSQFRRKYSGEYSEPNPNIMFVISPRDRQDPPNPGEVRKQLEAWLDEPNPAFGDQRPGELLQSGEGREHFARFVTGLEQGAFS